MNLRKKIKDLVPFVTRGDLANHFRQIESLIGIYSLTSQGFALGNLRGFAISPDALLIVIKQLVSIKCETVVEFGCGQSTLAMAKTLKTRNSGHLYSIEHSSQYLEKTKATLTALDLHDRVTLIHAPLTPDAHREMTYDLGRLPQISPDLVLIDGPSGKKGCRLSPLLWSHQSLAPQGCIFMDDFNRPEEQACVAKLRKSNPDVIVEEFLTEKGLAKISKP